MANGSATPKKHAHAVLEAMPGLVCYAGKQLNWRFDKATKQRVPMSRAEDFFGCFDAILVHPAHRLRLIQWTSRDGIYARRHKVEEKFCDPVMQLAALDSAPESAWQLATACADVEVWGWVRASGFRVWSYVYLDQTWEEQDVIRSPLLGKRKGEKDGS